VAADQIQTDDPSVHHLVELGYVDPHEIAARQAEKRLRLDLDLRRALDSINQGRGSEAIDTLQRLTSEDPEWTAPRQLLCEAEFRAGNHASARLHLDWLDLHNVISPRLAMIAGTIALEKRDLHAALVDLEYAAHADRQLAGAAMLLGLVQLRLGKLDAAEDAFLRAMQQNRSDARALDGLATIALHRKDFEDAAQWALKALEQEMQFYRAHYHLAVALVQLRHHPDAATKALLTCTQIDPSRAAPYYWLSRLARGQGDAALAADYRRQARQIIRQSRHRAEN
jgi:Tfp pilus assembly protein PilF